MLLGCPIDILTMTETVGRVHEAMRAGRRLQHVALNVAKLVNMQTDRVLAADVRDSDLVGIDGMGIVWAARCLGIEVKERVAGIDLFQEILAVCAKNGFRPYFLGATAEIVRKASESAGKKYPGICFAGVRDGYFRPEQESEIVEEIRASGADCLFIGMPTPRKERFLAAHRDRIGASFIMGVGGSFDVLAGHVRRAPPWIQAAGLEWIYRIYQEPRRMWWRYTRTNAIFATMVLRAIYQRSKSKRQS
jgi:N-acetylglucosaminyldiphosphoundecaprenol N-acetyl-beta-D-mannosaminyltransferase